MLRSQSALTPPGTDELTAPWNQPDDTREVFERSVCKCIGYEAFPGSDEFIDDLDGPLEQAQRTPNGGWACGSTCLSQAMFAAASDREKNSLRRLEIALREIEEHAEVARGILKTWANVNSEKATLSTIFEIRDAIAFHEAPSWINENEPREAVLERAIDSAVRDLEWNPSIHLRSNIDIEHQLHPTNAREYETRRAASTLASIGNIILRLKEAMKGGAR